MLAIIDKKKQAIAAAGNRCQGAPKHPECRARDGHAHPETDKPVSLVAFRLIPGDYTSLVVNCERCFLSRDFTAAYRNNDWRTERQASGNLELFPIDTPGGNR